MNSWSQVFKSRYSIPFLYLLSLILVFLLEIIHPDLRLLLSLHPRDMRFLGGIFTTVFVHKNLEHLSSNFLPLAVCLYGLAYFYRDIAGKVIFLSHLLTGILIWFFARPAFHIGASGLVYALVFFTLISGAIRRNRRLMIFALVVLLFQSGLVWGMFPTDGEISWESHLFGGITGTVMAIAFRKQGPPDDKRQEWDDESGDPEPEDAYKEIL